MSLTDQAELKEVRKTLSITKYNPRFAGDGKDCNRITGHCSNTDSCSDCILYQSIMKIREEKDSFGGKC